MQYVFLGIIPTEWGILFLKWFIAFVIIYAAVRWWRENQEQNEQDRNVNIDLMRDQPFRNAANARFARMRSIWKREIRPETDIEEMWEGFGSEMDVWLAAHQFYEDNPVVFAEFRQQFGAWLHTQNLTLRDARKTHYVIAVQDEIQEANELVGERASDWELVEDNLETNSMGWEK